jgi:N-acetylmuramic acid 6-phosphate (MurNAc-6-P) etherase
MPTIQASTPAPRIDNYPRGDSRLFVTQIFQADGKTPYSLAGATVMLTVNANTNNTTNSDASAIIAVKDSSFICPATTTLPSGVVITTGSDTTALGIAWLLVTNTITQDITPATYYYDIQLVTANGNITSLAQNRFTIIADVTRSIS